LHAVDALVCEVGEVEGLVVEKVCAAAVFVCAGAGVEWRRGEFCEGTVVCAVADDAASVFRGAKFAPAGGVAVALDVAEFEGCAGDLLGADG